MGHRGIRKGQDAEVGTKLLEDCLEEEADRAQEGAPPSAAGAWQVPITLQQLAPHPKERQSFPIP